jgi:hypothetical protein
VETHLVRAGDGLAATLIVLIRFLIRRGWGLGVVETGGRGKVGTRLFPDLNLYGKSWFGHGLPTLTVA